MIVQRDPVAGKGGSDTGKKRKRKKTLVRYIFSSL